MILTKDFLNKIKIIPDLDSLKIGKLEDAIYFSNQYNDYISNSRLNLIDPKRDGTPSKFFEGLSKHKQYGSSLDLGNAVHTQCLQPEYFNLIYGLEKPSGKLGAVCDYLINNKLIPNEENIYRAMKEIDYYRGDPGEKRFTEAVKKINVFLRNYLNYMKSETRESLLEKVSKVNPTIIILKGCIKHTEPISCKCSLCGNEFYLLYNNIMKGEACASCSRKRIMDDRRRKSKIEYDKYISTLTIQNLDEFVDMNTKLKMRCSECGIEWYADPAHTMRRNLGCPECAKKKMGQYRKLNNESIIKNFKNKHGDIYDYSKVNYVNYKTKVCIICPKHGEFWLTPGDHIHGTGCPVCNKSRGERDIEKYFKLNNIQYITLYKIDIPTNIYSRGFTLIDFYLPDYNMFIEYNGLQHYVPIKHFGGQLKFDRQKQRDTWLQNYCTNNNINLLIIRYDEDLNNILNEHFNRH